jgi:hypothetical protein
MLENAGLFVRDESVNVMPATAIKPNSVTTITTENGPEEVLVTHSESLDDDSMAFSVTVLDSDNLNAIGEDYTFNVPNETLFSVHDFYDDEVDCFYSEMSDDELDSYYE